MRSTRHLGREQRPGDVALRPRHQVVQVPEQVVLVRGHEAPDLVRHLPGVVDHHEAVGVRAGGLEAGVLRVVCLALGEPPAVRPLGDLHLLVQEGHQPVRLRGETGETGEDAGACVWVWAFVCTHAAGPGRAGPDERTDERTNRRTNGRTDERTNG